MTNFIRMKKLSQIKKLLTVLIKKINIMKNLISTKKVHTVSDDLTSMQTATTVYLFGFTICTLTNTRKVSISIGQ